MCCDGRGCTRSCRPTFAPAAVDARVDMFRVLDHPLTASADQLAHGRHGINASPSDLNQFGGNDRRGSCQAAPGGTGGEASLRRQPRPARADWHGSLSGAGSEARIGLQRHDHRRLQEAGADRSVVEMITRCAPAAKAHRASCRVWRATPTERASGARSQSHATGCRQPLQESPSNGQPFVGRTFVRLRGTNCLSQR